MTAAAAIPWRDRAFVTVREAAVILARSPDWIRMCVVEERLVGARLTAGGPFVISVPSLLRLADDAQPVRLKAARPRARSRRRKLRLVVDNT